MPSLDIGEDETAAGEMLNHPRERLRLPERHRHRPRRIGRRQVQRLDERLPQRREDRDKRVHESA